MKKLILLVTVFAMIFTLALGAVNVNAGDSSTKGNFTFKIDNDVAVITKVNTAASGKIIVPDTLGDFPVGVIDEEAFKGCTKITEIVLPETVTTIKDSAFSGCSSLESITFYNKLKTIGADAFKGCSKLAKVTYYGTEDDKAAIKIGKGNDALTDATWKFVEPTPEATATPKPTNKPAATQKPTQKPAEATPEATPENNGGNTPNLTWFWFVIGGVVVAAIGTLVVFLIVNNKKSDEEVTEEE